MAKTDVHMSQISSAIHDQAQGKAREIIERANTLRDSELQQFEERLYREMCETVRDTTASLRTEAQANVSAAEREAYHGLLRVREELTQSIFDHVVERLRAFAATPEYRRWLLDALGGWQAKYGSDCTVYLRPEDMDQQDGAAAVLPGCTVRESADIAIGGYILEYERSGVRIDETLETRLREQKPWFLLHCDMQVQ